MISQFYFSAKFYDKGIAEDGDDGVEFARSGLRPNIEGGGTIADLAGAENISSEHVSEAI